MKKILLTLLSVFIITGAMAANSVVTVEQVTTAISLTNDVDYHITSSTPFVTTGSIDIVNTEHAVIILDAIKPSKATSFLTYIKINGEKAINGSNCDVRMYNNGCIIFPYPSNIKPLTVFEEANFGGESFNEFGLENSGGYMNSFSGTKKAWNNRIRSFKLKRGYMVTFSLKAGGRGYSRCFVADKEDIAINLSTLMAGRVSSYRVFKWWNFSKKGIANATGATIISKLNATGCFDWAQGNSERLPDCEWVPNHIYEDWPSSSTCGGVTGSPHMKTNNEPLNQADDKPQTLEDILANWENLMRTGQRLCSPASWDGSPNFTRQFLDSIDARGWRCDIVDLHCYWTEGSFNNLGNMYNNYRRPIWISEFCWGASWNNNGVFAYKDNTAEAQAQNRTVMGRILDRLNSWDYIERYFYWNSEAWYSRVYNDDKLTSLGEYYAQMNTGIGYNANRQYVPTPPRMYSPIITGVTFNPAQSVATITWTDNNGDLMDKLYLERKIDNGTWEIVKEVTPNDETSSYSAKDTATVSGYYAYRIRTVAYNKSERTSAEMYNILNGTTKTSSPLFQYGKLEVNNSKDTYNYFAEPYPNANDKKQPAIVFGSVTNANGNAMLVERVSAVQPRNGQYFYFKANIAPATEATTNDKTEFYQTANEVTHFLTAAPGRDKIGSLNYEAGVISSKTINTVVEYTFSEPFETTPVVLATPVYTYTKYPIFWNITEVTPQGFKIVMKRQHALDSDILKPSASISFIAIEKGETKDGEGKLITVGDSTLSFSNASSLSSQIALGHNYENMMPLVQLQSCDRDIIALLRLQQHSTTLPKNSIRLRLQIDKTNTDNATMNSNNKITGRVGWVVISDAPEEDGIESISITPAGGNIAAYPSVVTYNVAVRDDAATSVAVYSMNGRQLTEATLTNGQANIDLSALPAGVYIVRSNAGNSTKIIKK